MKKKKISMTFITNIYKNKNAEMILFGRTVLNKNQSNNRLLKKLPDSVIADFHFLPQQQNAVAQFLYDSTVNFFSIYE